MDVEKIKQTLTKEAKLNSNHLIPQPLLPWRRALLVLYQRERKDLIKQYNYRGYYRQNATKTPSDIMLSMEKRS